MLCSGTFQHHLVHGSLNYHEAANVAEVICKYKLCLEALNVLKSEAYNCYFDSSVPQPDRSVITFRKIENHLAGCPEVVAGEGRRLPVSTTVGCFEALTRRRGAASSAAAAPVILNYLDTAERSNEPIYSDQEDACRARAADTQQEGVWRPVPEPPGSWEVQTREEERAAAPELGGAKGDRQHEVIPGEPPESQEGAWARPEGPTQLQERAAAPEFGAGLGEVQAEAREGSSSSEAREISGLPLSAPLSRPPPADMLPEDMLPEDSEALAPPPASAG